jgi:hypothetical protein
VFRCPKAARLNSLKGQRVEKRTFERNQRF